MILVYDTETTGLPDFKLPADDPRQPRMIQLAFALYDRPDKLVLEECHLIKPDGWKMPRELADKLGHGLTQERLEREGKPVKEVLEAFNLKRDRATLLAAYGIRFDQKILRGELRRGGFPDRYAETPEYCVMRAATPLCKMPPTDAMMAAGRCSYKTPKLTEAARIILGVEHVGAHDALADVRMTARLYFHITFHTKGLEKSA